MIETPAADEPTGEHPPEAENSTVWRRWLALELRRLRMARGLTQRQAGKAIKRTHAHISNIEQAARAIDLEDLETLLMAYGVPEDSWIRYQMAAERARHRGWWEHYNRQDLPGWFSPYVGLEQGAASLQAYEPSHIHGLLQTREYTRALLGSGAITRTKPHIERLVDLRTNRQEILRRKPSPLNLSVVTDEGALRRIVGNPAVMKHQLDYLATLTTVPNVEIRIMTFAQGNPVSTAGFAILDFPWDNDTGAVYVELLGSALFLEDMGDVDRYRLVFDHLCAKALSPDESSELIGRLAREMKQ